MKLRSYGRILLLGVLALAARSSLAKQNTAGLSIQETSAVKAVLEHFRTAWLANDADGVRGVFVKNAVLLPHHGVPPVAGMDAINQFWFPPTTAETTITKFVQTIDEVDGDGSLAYLRGRSEVAWTIRDKGTSQSWQTHGNFLAVLKRQNDGRWLISHLIWDDVPNELVQ